MKLIKDYPASCRKLFDAATLMRDPRKNEEPTTKIDFTVMDLMA
jgi:hypothetical protein